MLSLFVLLTVAQADTQIRCFGAEVGDTRPAPGQSEVPVDARIVATLVGDCVWGPFYAELLDAEGELVLSEQMTPGYPPAAYPIVLHPDSPLSANTDHLLRVTPVDFGEAVEVGFRTGAGQVVGIGDETPSLTIEDAFFERSGADWLVYAAARVDAVPDPDALSLVRVGVVDDEALNADQLSAVVVPGGADVARVDGWLYSDRRPDELCLEATQIDGLGVETEPVTACVSVERRGCSAAATPPGLFAAALALFGLSRRVRKAS